MKVNVDTVLAYKRLRKNWYDYQLMKKFRGDIDFTDKLNRYCQSLYIKTIKTRKGDSISLLSFNPNNVNFLWLSKYWDQNLNLNDPNIMFDHFDVEALAFFQASKV